MIANWGAPTRVCGGRGWSVGIDLGRGWLGGRPQGALVRGFAAWEIFRAGGCDGIG